MSAPPVERSIAAEIRRAYPRVLARLLAMTRSLDRAEDALHDAIERGLRSWPLEGAPDSVEAWLVTVATNRHRDSERHRARASRHAEALSIVAASSPWSPETFRDARPWDDELLRLLFACCDPVLATGESAALALATVIGLSGRELAAAFVVAPRAMEQRLTRARRRLRERRGALDLPHAALAEERLGPALASIHLVFNEGYWSTDDAAPIRKDLCTLAIDLAGSLHVMLPQHAEIEGLLATMILHDARRAARLDDQGRPVPLPAQDRSRWDRGRIAAAEAVLARALARGAPGPYQLEAAIAAVHCGAARAEDTDWPQIALLYEMLEARRPSPLVRVNRAFAVARTEGASAGLALLDAAGAALSTIESAYPDLVRGTLLGELGRHVEAIAALEAALVRARNAHEAGDIRRMIDEARRRVEEGTEPRALPPALAPATPSGDKVEP